VHRPDLPESLAQFVMRALARDLSVRFSSWAEFSRELTQAYRHLEIPSDTITDTQKYDAIRKVPFFREFRDSDTWEIVRMSSWHRHSANKVILKEGEAGDSVFIIVDGEARVSKGGNNVDTLGKGDCFGELLYFEETRPQRASTITASSALTVVEIKAQALQQSSDTLQKLFNKAFLRILVNRLSQVSDR